MPVHNAEPFIRDAVESILQQSYADFRLIVIDDGSTDLSVDIIESVGDPRIELLRLDWQRGVAFALNHGLERAETEFIARMDADDLALPHRIEQQVAFLDANPEIGVCGSAIRMFQGVSCRVVSYPETHCEIAANLAVHRRSMCHPSVMMRRSVFMQSEEQYRDKYIHAEDLDLWHRLIGKTRFHNLSEPLLLYRVHQHQTSTSQREAQMAATYRLLLDALPKYFPQVSPGARETFARLVTTEEPERPSVSFRCVVGQFGRHAGEGAARWLELLEASLIAKLCEQSFKSFEGLRNTTFIWWQALRREPLVFLEVLAVARFRLSVRLRRRDCE